MMASIKSLIFLKAHCQAKMATDTRGERRRAALEMTDDRTLATRRPFVALSRRKQGFESPSDRQLKQRRTNRPAALCNFCVIYKGAHWRILVNLPVMRGRHAIHQPCRRIRRAAARQRGARRTFRSGELIGLAGPRAEPTAFAIASASSSRCAATGSVVLPSNNN